MGEIARQRRHGQLWTMDFILGSVVLLFVLMNFVIIWDNIALRGNLADAHMKMEAGAYFASESLLATPGEPESWEMLPHIDDNVSALGLVNGRNELNRMKLEKMVAENATAYDAIKARLGLSRYQFGMLVSDLSGNEEYYEFGRFSGGSLNNSLEFDRFGLLDNEPVIVHMEVWGG
jgi:hypothetical protein